MSIGAFDYEENIMNMPHLPPIFPDVLPDRPTVKDRILYLILGFLMNMILIIVSLIIQ